MVAAEADFFSQVASATGVIEGDEQTTWISGASLNDDQVYYWKVRAFDGFFHGEWSETFTFNADASVPTSVKLIDFWGDISGNAVVLNWLTSIEVDNSGFTIYRSLEENKNFVKVGEIVSGGGDSNYSFEDSGIQGGNTYFYRLEALSTFGTAEVLGTISVQAMLPVTFQLHQNYPNPFNPTTTIKFDLPKQSNVQIKIYNMLGQEVKTLLNEERVAGFYDLKWDSRNNNGIPVSSGIYIYRIVTGDFVKARKMLLIR